MYPFFNTNTISPIEASELEQEFLAICKKHKEDKKALAFAFLIHDLTNANVEKILHDPDYFRALHELSGKYLTTFYVHSQHEFINKRERSASEDRIGFMTGIYAQSTPNRVAQTIIERYFGISGEIRLPAILFFQVDDEEVVDSFLVELKNEEIEKTFIEIKGHIKGAVDSLKGINLSVSDSGTIFRELRTAIENRNQRVIMGRLLNKLTIGNLISLFTSLK